MVKTLILSASIIAGMASFSPASAQKSKGPNASVKTEVKFLEDISVTVAPLSVSIIEVATKTNMIPAIKSDAAISAIETVSALQLKYAILLDTEVEGVVINPLLETIEAWWGTRYQYGGHTKDGIDCSAFMQILYNAHFNITLPRTAREQFEGTEHIEKDALQQGDLVFFNTRGGVSHVGMYLQNNKFAHAATSGGVMISDLDEAYWSQRYIGAGRMVAAPFLLTALQP